MRACASQAPSGGLEVGEVVRTEDLFQSRKPEMSRGGNQTFPTLLVGHREAKMGVGRKINLFFILKKSVS